MLWTAFMLGLLGSTHCVGMCGPIAIALPTLNMYDRLKIWLSSLLYNTGRIISYGLLGLLFGIVGQTIAISGFQKGITIGIGVLLLLTGLFSISIEDKLLRISFLKKCYTYIQASIGRQFRKNGLKSYLLVGFFNGFLPCGMVYMAVAGALVSSQVINGMLFMVFFGLGTLPLMMALTLSRNLIPVKVKSALRKIAPLVIISFGIFILLRGINVELPAELSFWEMVSNPVMCH